MEIATHTLSRCPHTGHPLLLRDPPGEGFLLSEEGVVYAREARSLEYGADYFLEEYRNQYGRSYLEDEPKLRQLARSRLSLLSPLVQPPARLLEIGAATGFFLDEARQAGYRCEGVEISPFASRYARENLGLDVRTGSFLDLPLEGSFQVVAAFYVLEHFADQRRLFSRISSLLAPGGVFLFALPSTHGPLYRRSIREWRESHPADHFADYSPRSLRKILPLYDMELASVRPASYHPERAGALWEHAPLSSLYKFFARWREYGDTMEGVARKKGYGEP